MCLLVAESSRRCPSHDLPDEKSIANSFGYRPQLGRTVCLRAPEMCRCILRRITCIAICSLLAWAPMCHHGKYLQHPLGRQGRHTCATSKCSPKGQKAVNGRGRRSVRLHESMPLSGRILEH